MFVESTYVEAMYRTWQYIPWFGISCRSLSSTQEDASTNEFNENDRSEGAANREIVLHLFTSNVDTMITQHLYQVEDSDVCSKSTRKEWVLRFNPNEQDIKLLFVVNSLFATRFQPYFPTTTERYLTEDEDHVAVVNTTANYKCGCLTTRQKLFEPVAPNPCEGAILVELLPGCRVWLENAEYARQQPYKRFSLHCSQPLMVVRGALFMSLRGTRSF